MTIDPRCFIYVYLGLFTKITNWETMFMFVNYRNSTNS